MLCLFQTICCNHSPRVSNNIVELEEDRLLLKREDLERHTITSKEGNPSLH